MIGNRCRANDYCCEDISLIENYEEAMNSEEEYDCHHRLESHDENGNLRETFVTRDELKRLGKYYKVKANELIFLPRKEHLSMHSNNRWNDDDFRKVRSERMKGENNPYYNKHHSEEIINKIKATKEKNGTLHKATFEGKRHSEEAKEKMRNAKRKYFENGGVSPMKGKRLSEEAKKLHSEQLKGRHLYNNGEVTIMAFECPEGFVPGRLKK